MAPSSLLGLPWPPAAGAAFQVEDAILTYLPSCLVFLLTPALFIYYREQPACHRYRWLSLLKLSCAATIVFAEAASVLMRCTLNDFDHRRDFPTLTIDLIIALSIAFAIFQEHHRKRQTSAFLGLHLALGIVVEITKSRQGFRQLETWTLGYITAVSAVTRLLLLLIDEIPRGTALFQDHPGRSPNKEASSGFWGRALFLWLNSTLFLGFRTQLTLDDLDSIGPEFSSETLSQQFKIHWEAVADDPKRKLALVCARALLKPLLAVALPRFAFAACSLMQPFLLQRLLVAVETDELDKYTRDSLVQAFFLVYFGIAASRASYQHMSYRLMTKVRGMLIAEVLEKSHTLSQAESMKAAAVTLITNDIQAISTGVTLLYEVPVHLVEVVLGMCCLAVFVGTACFVVILPLLFSITFGSCMARFSGRAMVTWNENIQQRVSQTSKVLSQLRVIKMLGLGPTISSYLQRLRETEVASSRKYLGLQSALSASQMLTSTITPVLVVGAALYSGFMAKLTTAQVVPCLAAVALIQRPLYRILAISSRIAAMFTCLARVQQYLELEEDLDERVLMDPLPACEKDDEDAQRLPPTAIEFVDVTLLSRSSNSEVIEHANFALARGSITAALGPSGSGKSALLQSLLGDSNVVDGFLYIDEGIIGYADQSPWLRNLSIRDNIVGNLPFDFEWYMTILQVCLLIEDLDHLPGRDRYIVGTNGMNLSGGQRHRISLARALYCRAPIVVLDDIFSTLDRKTAVSILFQLCGENGLLRRVQCTVVLATYLPESLEVVDQLLLFDGKGGVVLEHDFHDEAFRVNLVNALRNQAATKKIESEDQERATLRRYRELQDSAEPPASLQPPPKRQSNEALYEFFINSSGKSSFLIWLLIVFLVSVSETVPDVFIRIWTEVAPESMAYFAGYAGASILATVVTAAANGILFYVLAPRSSTSLHERLTHVVMRSTLAFFSSTDTGSILNRYSQDMNATMQDLPAHALRFFYMLFHVLLQVIIIGTGMTHMVTVLPFVVAAVAILLFYYVQTSRQIRHMELETKTPLYNHFTETASGLRHIRALGWRSSNITAGLSLLDTSQKTTYIASSIKRWLGLVVDLLTCGVSVMLTILSMEHKDTTSTPAIGLSFLILITFGLSLEYFIDSWADMDKSINALSRLRDFMLETPTEAELPPIDLPTSWPQTGEIQMKQVTATYRSNMPAALEDISLHMKSGCKVGITGRTGSGKSSLFMSILGFLEYTGTIEIDGIDISRIPQDVLRSRIITISQDYLDLGGTVRNNLLPFELNMSAAESIATDQEINDVLDLVGLLQRVEKQGGLDAQLSKIGLSHGQLQLLSIGRAILRGNETQTKLVLVDEATSNVDLETDATIQQVLRQSFAGCTILMIAHRLDTIQDADMFVELAHGKASIA